MLGKDEPSACVGLNLVKMLVLVCVEYFFLLYDGLAGRFAMFLLRGIGVIYIYYCTLHTKLAGPWFERE